MIKVKSSQFEQLEGETVIKLEHVHCMVGRRSLLQDINWTVTSGEHWLIYCANGSGKTTLLSLIAGYGKYSSGCVKILGQFYTDDTVFSLRKKVGWVSTSFFDKYYRKESVSDLLLSALSGTLGMRSYESLKNIKLVKRGLACFGLQNKFYYPYDTLSKGEQQKVLLVRAFLQQPEILLLDEPASGLDIASETYIRELIKELVENNRMTILYVSHHPYEFGGIFDHCLLLEQGKIKACGLTEEIVKVGDSIHEKFIEY